MKDAQFVKTKAFPAAGATNQTATFDFGAITSPERIFPEHVELEISVPALSAHTDTSKNYVLKVQDSADDSSYADLAVDVVLTTPGIASTGTSAQTFKVRLPSNTRRYVQINQAVDSGGPTLTGSSVTYSFIFH